MPLTAGWPNADLEFAASFTVISVYASTVAESGREQIDVESCSPEDNIASGLILSCAAGVDKDSRSAHASGHGSLQRADCLKLTARSGAGHSDED
ncbi:uncharacterized protein UDID_18384 [Ustilago sp. UG-2017a]|nr:uncharacterized protein UDID_18384 [Ustilago sp. UG-2017a]